MSCYDYTPCFPLLPGDLIACNEIGQIRSQMAAVSVTMNLVIDWSVGFYIDLSTITGYDSTILFRTKCGGRQLFICLLPGTNLRAGLRLVFLYSSALLLGQVALSQYISIHIS